MAAKTLSEAALIRAFEDLSLPKESFDHREHVRLAWALMRGWPRDVAFRRFAMGLKKFAQHHEVPGLYHETVTFFFLHAIEERLRAMPLQHDWRSFANRNADLVDEPGAFLRRHYDAEVLDSRLARGHFILPKTARLEALSGT